MAGASGHLTTHVLDTAAGAPAAGVGLTLERLDPTGRTPLAAAVTNGDGRVDAPLLDGARFVTGLYELTFAAGAYFAAAGRETFLEDVPVRFRIDDETAHYHVPLLLSPFGYSTYRGS